MPAKIDYVKPAPTREDRIERLIQRSVRFGKPYAQRRSNERRKAIREAVREG